jgi:rhodanese-related sulfurtransferase
MKVLLVFVLSIAMISIGCESSSIKEISIEQAKSAIVNQQTQFIDVRTSAEFNGEHAENATNCPLDSLEKDSAKLDKNKPVYVICQSGKRSKDGAKKLQDAGFKEVYSVSGGTNAWKQNGLPLAKTN